jgi:hypothetical protein
MDEADLSGVDPLLWRRKDTPEVNRQRGFADVVAALDVDELVAEYEHDRRVAPRRSDRSKQYFVAGHDGIPASGESTTRIEEHLALALFGLCSAGGRLVCPSGDRLRLVAYQVPLKARQTDQAGKIDLLGLLDDGRVCIVELKAPDGFGDSPLRALIEGLSYAAVLEANRAMFDEELIARYPGAAPGTAFVVVLLGPTSWWQAWETSHAAGTWKQPFNELCAALETRLGVTIACAALGGFDRPTLTLGLNRQAPSLGSVPMLLDVPGLPAIPGAVMRARHVNSYLGSLLAAMRTYAASSFEASMFDGRSEVTRPPVFRSEHAHRNVIAAPDDAMTAKIVSALPVAGRHRHFASMRSSQALTQSVFGGLAVTGHLGVLEEVYAECGRPAFANYFRAHTMEFEKQVTWLAEPRSTSVDVWFDAPTRRIAVECKLTESEFGRCSRPLLARDNPSHCDGSYRQQMERQHRCALSELGIAYWQHIPALFDWAADRDHVPCPVDATYQIVRNILAAVVTPDGRVDGDTGHALVVYDARSPAFARGGAARDALDIVYGALRYPEVLRMVSWQTVIARIAVEPECRWLTDTLSLKYGLIGDTTTRPRPHSDAASVNHPSLPPARGQGRIASLSFVYGHAIDPDGYVLLSTRTNSYKLRNPRRADWTSGYRLDGIPTVDALLDSGLIEDIKPVDKRAGRVNSDQIGWERLLAEIDAQWVERPRSSSDDAL